MADPDLTRRAFALGAALLAAGPALSPALASGGMVIEGEVKYRERMALPAGALVELTVQDVSRADAPAERVSSGVIPAGTGSPIAFRMDLPWETPDPKKSFAIRAKIIVEGEVWFTSTDHIPVPAAGGGRITIPVQRIGSSEAAGVTPYGSWHLTSLGGRPGAAGVTTDLTLTDKGEAYGAGGCNRFTGRFTHDGAALSFGPLASTNMACIGGGMEQEALFHAALSDTAAFALEEDGAALSLKDARGHELVRLARSAG